MSDAAAKIAGLERRVMWRKRFLSLLDQLAVAAVFGGLAAAALILLVRIRAAQFPIWILVVAALGLSSVTALVHWFIKRTHEQEAAFLIDESLGLEDRVATAHLIIERGGPSGALEEALIEDAAERAGKRKASSVIPLRVRRRYAPASVSLIALTAALMIAPRALPVNEVLQAERADINNAADQLEQTAAEVEQIVPAGTETAGLATEQAGLGRELRRSTTTRAEALKRLSGLEERIRRRHDDLASTRADEIVTLADRRLGAALSTLSKTQLKKPQPDEGKLASSPDRPIDVPKRQQNETPAIRSSGGKALDPPAPANEKPRSTASTDRARPGEDQSKSEDQRKPQNSSQQPAAGQDARNEEGKNAVSKTNPSGAQSDKTNVDQKPGDPKSNSENNPLDKSSPGEKDSRTEKVDQQGGEKSSGETDALKAAPDSLLKQAAKALPKLSEDLLKKAAALRANELSTADIEKLRKAAEFLSRDLEQIAQSKELQRALQEMARQVSPEQLERVAHELGNQEKLKQELESAGRLLAENQQAKEIVAGLAGEFSRVRDQMRKQQQNQKAEGQSGESQVRNEQSGSGDRASRKGSSKSPDNLNSTGDRTLAGQGKESSLKGKLQQGSRGEYLFLESKAGTGAARAPYSSAYPAYRREAERSVQRTRVPANLRSVVRKYFDAINPDSKR